VTRLYPTANNTYEYPQATKLPVLAKDGMSATVELYGNLADKTKYVVTLEGYEPLTFTASVGDPTSIVLSASDKEFTPFVTVSEQPSKIYYTLYDANGVDVTSVATGTVLFSADTFSTDGSYYVSNDTIWFSKADVLVNVIADYQSGKYENGVQVGCFKSSPISFYSTAVVPTEVVGVEAYTITGWTNPATSVPFGEKTLPNLEVKIDLSKGDSVVAKNGGSVLNGTITYEELTPDVAALSGSDIIFFKQGVAKFIVNYVTVVNGTENVLPIGVATVEAKAPRALNTIKLDQTAITLGTVDNYDSTTITVTAKDIYNADWNMTSVTVEGVDDNSKAAMAGVDYTTTKGKIVLDGSAMIAAVSNNPNTVQLTFKVKVDNKLEQNFTVLVKNPGATGTEYINIEKSGLDTNIARTLDSKNVKTASFTVFQMSNGVKVGAEKLEKYNASSVSAGAYYFTVTKDGSDITNNANVDVSAMADGKVTLNFSNTLKTFNGTDKDENAVSGNYVEYGLGAGNYVFTLYKGVQVGDKVIGVQQRSVAGAVTCNQGAYSSAVKLTDSVKSLDDKSIREAFSIKDTKNKEATSVYSVDVVDTAAGYVYVKSITFYDDLGNGQYAPYTVNIGTSLKK